MQYPYVIDVTVWDSISFKFYIADFQGGSWYALEDRPPNDGPDTHWKDWDKTLSMMMTSGQTVIDCGAHHGFLTMIFSRLVGESGHVFAIEGKPENAEIIRKNVELNGMKNVTVLNRIVSDVSDAKLSFGEERVQDFGDFNRNPNMKSKVVVETMKIDDLYSHKPSFIKIDVEGFEYFALKGAENTLRDFKPNIELEIHYHRDTIKGGVDMRDYDPDSFEKIKAIMARHGYKFYIDGRLLPELSTFGAVHCFPWESPPTTLNI